MGSFSQTNQITIQKSVLLVEPESLVRFAIKQVIETIPGFKVDAEASTYEEAIELIGIADFNILITEIPLSGVSGLELVREFKRRKNKIKAVILSRVNSLDVIKEAFLLGAQAYVLKEGSFEDLKMALQSIDSSRKFIPPQITSLVDMPANFYEIGESSHNTDPLHPLSTREREIFHLLAKGLRNAEIASKLFISPRTVETHRARIMKKLNLASNGELIHYAFRHKLTVAE